jgi:hypothetical protein
MPDHGVDPDHPIDPDAGDEPSDPNHTTADDAATKDKEASASDPNTAPDPKTMTRAERAAFYGEITDRARKEVESVVNDAYKPKALDDVMQQYLDDGKTELEARMLARDDIREQEADINRATAERAELNATLAIESTEVLNSIDWLNPNKKDAYDKTSTDAAVQMYDNLCLIRDDNTAQVDPQGNPIPGTGQIMGAMMTPKQFYGLVDTIRNSGSEAARQSAQKAAEEQMAAVAAPSSNTTKRESNFDSLSNAEKRAKLMAQGILIT